MTLYKWSQTAATNATADASINWAEGQAPSTVNDSARGMMAATAKYRDDTSGKLVTAGISTAYTLTTNQGFASLVLMDGQSLTFKVHATNGAAPTLNVDGLGAKAINAISGTAVPTGELVLNGIYEATYLNATNEWVLTNRAGQSATNPVTAFPSTTAMLFAQTAAPTGWTKSATHNNKALRLVNGTVTTGGTTAFTTVFAARTIAQGNLPAVALSVSGTCPIPKITGTTALAVAATQPAQTAQAFTGGASIAVYDTSVHTAMDAQALAGGVTSNLGSGSTIDFAVQFVDVILATKD